MLTNEIIWKSVLFWKKKKKPCFLGALRGRELNDKESIMCWIKELAATLCNFLEIVCFELW